jgi:hypothetical protein
MTDLIATALASAAVAAENQGRGRLLWRIDGRECRQTSADTITITGAGREPFVHCVEGIDFAELT